MNKTEEEKELKKKNQASSGESCKSGLIYQTYNLLNHRFELNQEAQHRSNKISENEMNKFNLIRKQNSL
jgi:hypothetical protein